MAPDTNAEPVTDDFAARYGPWALIAGASEGIGSALAEELARRGLNLALLARRAEVLDQVAAGIAERTGVQTRTLAIDLDDPDAAATIAAALADVEVGFLAYCAGADGQTRPFLDSDVGTAEALIRRNCLAPARVIHALAGPMRARGRGAVVTFSSGAAFVGGASLAVYGGTKAFDLVFTEGLWAELEPHGVHVLSVVLGETDTPALRRLQSGDAGRPVKGATPVPRVVDGILANLDRGPTLLVGPQVKVGSKLFGLLPRRAGVRMLTKAAARTLAGENR